MGKTAIDIVLEVVSSGSITREDAKILLEAINKPPQTITVTAPYRETITANPDWTYDPYRPGQPWYTTTGTDNTTPVTNKITTNG
jgi:hypothetical protein